MRLQSSFFFLLLLTYKTPVRKIVYNDVQLCNVLAFIVTMSISFSPLYTFFAVGHLSVFILLLFFLFALAKTCCLVSLGTCLFRLLSVNVTVQDAATLFSAATFNVRHQTFQILITCYTYNIIMIHIGRGQHCAVVACIQ